MQPPRSNPRDGTLLLLAACARAGAAPAPHTVPWSLECSPVDDVASAVAERAAGGAAGRAAGEVGIVHLHVRPSWRASVDDPQI